MLRVVTLLPAATEIVCALGAQSALVGVSHECDYPQEILGLPRITTTPIDPEWSGARIDRAVRELGQSGTPVVAVDAEQLGRLRPDLIITQSLCDVCAVADGEVWRLAQVLDPAPRILTLTASDLAGIWQDISTVANALDIPEEGEELVLGLQSRLRRIARPGASRPRVLTVEWLEPAYAAGHWVPELIHAAGGHDPMATPGQHSRRFQWEAAASLRADLVAVMLCGFGVDRSLRELRRLEDPAAIQVLESAPVWVLDGNAYTSRAGPRVVEGARLLRSALDGAEAPGLVRYHHG
jgi:iron complex transport system substrate-binding protein